MIWWLFGTIPIKKKAKVLLKVPSTARSAPKTPLWGCNSKTSFRKNCKKDVKMRLKSVFPLKKFGNPILKQYLCTTRTRQASPRCSNVRVVLFLYNEQQNSIPEALHQCARPCLSLAVKRLDGYRYSKGWELSRIYRLLPPVSLYVSFITVAKGATSL